MGQDDEAARTLGGAAPAISAQYARLAERTRALLAWQRRLVAELAAFPETLANLRSGAANFERVGRRLDEVTETLEQVTNTYSSTMTEATRRTASAASAMRDQIDALSTQSPDQVHATLTELQQTVESLTRLNPFWPRRPKDD